MSTATAASPVADPSTLAPSNWGDPTGEGIMAAMEKAFDNTPAAPEPTKPAEPAAKATSEPAKPAEVVPAAPVEAVKAPDPTPPLIDEEFFSDAAEATPEVKPESKPGEFDETAFDKQTEEVVKGFDVKAATKFKELRAELKVAKQTVITPDVQAKLSELELKASELDGVKARLAEVSSQSAKLKVESGDKYLAEVAQPAADIFTRADALATMYEGEPSILRAIIKERDRKTQNELIAEHLKEFSDFDRSEVYRMVQDFNGLITKREKMLANAEVELETEKTQRIEGEKRALQEQRLAVQRRQKDIWDKYKEVIPGLSDEQGDTPALKALVAKSMAIDFSQAKANDMAFAAFAGSVLPHAVKEIAALRKELLTYRADETRARAAAPDAGGSVQATPADPNKPKTFMELMNEVSFA